MKFCIQVQEGQQFEGRGVDRPTASLLVLANLAFLSLPMNEKWISP
jgi:hypothetical protein